MAAVHQHQSTQLFSVACRYTNMSGVRLIRHEVHAFASRRLPFSQPQLDTLRTAHRMPLEFRLRLLRFPAGPARPHEQHALLVGELHTHSQRGHDVVLSLAGDDALRAGENFAAWTQNKAMRAMANLAATVSTALARIVSLNRLRFPSVLHTVGAHAELFATTATPWRNAVRAAINPDDYPEAVDHVCTWLLPDDASDTPWEVPLTLSNAEVRALQAAPDVAPTASVFHDLETGHHVTTAERLAVMTVGALAATDIALSLAEPLIRLFAPDTDAASTVTALESLHGDAALIVLGGLLVSPWLRRWFPLNSWRQLVLLPVAGLLYGRDQTMAGNVATTMATHPSVPRMMAAMGQVHLRGVSQHLVADHGAEDVTEELLALLK